MAIQRARAVRPGIYGSNQQYREVGEEFELEEGRPMPDWAEPVKPEKE